MTSFDGISGIKVVNTNVPGTVVADTDLDGVDGRGFETITHLLALGAEGDVLSGSVFIEFFLEESDDDSTYTAVTDAFDALINSGSQDGVVTLPAALGLFATINAAAEADKVFMIGYSGNKRFSRVRTETTGTHTNGTPLAALAIQGRPAVSPVA